MVLALIAPSCSRTEQPAPIVVTRVATVALPPEARKATPALSPKPPSPRDLTQDETLINWSSDRVARNIGEYRRAACVAAVDAAGQP